MPHAAITGEVRCMLHVKAHTFFQNVGRCGMDMRQTVRIRSVNPTPWPVAC